MNDPFESPKFLISHARDQIEDARKRVRTFIDSNPFARVVDIDIQTRQQIHKIKLTADLPQKISAVVKDAAGNLRDALDHAVYGCAISLKGGFPKDTGFPFARDAIGVIGELKSNRLSGNPSEIHALLAWFQPHEGGNDLLWGLNSIRNPNTHRMIVPVGHAVINQSLSIDFSSINGPSEFGYSQWDATKNEIEFMRLGHGSNIEYQVNTTLSVVFEGTNALTGKPVISTLNTIASEVERVVLATEAETARILAARIP